VWLVDASDFEGLDGRVAALGRPRAVLQLLDRHDRDGAAIADRLGVPLLVMPEELPGTPFEVVPVPAMRGWREVALWWPERRTLVVADAVGTAAYYVAPGRRLGVNPVMRLFRPPKALLRFEPEHVLVGHGEGLHENATEELRLAVRHARRDLPRVVPKLFRAGRG
jgi:hypothetical protein